MTSVSSVVKSTCAARTTESTEVRSSAAHEPPVRDASVASVSSVVKSTCAARTTESTEVRSSAIHEPPVRNASVTTVSSVVKSTCAARTTESTEVRSSAAHEPPVRDASVSSVVKSTCVARTTESTEVRSSAAHEPPVRDASVTSVSSVVKPTCCANRRARRHESVNRGQKKSREWTRLFFIVLRTRLSRRILRCSARRPRPWTWTLESAGARERGAPERAGTW